MARKCRISGSDINDSMITEMNLEQGVFGRIMAKEWRKIAFSVLLVASLAFFVSTLIPPKYESETRILILQKNMDSNAYQAAKSSEFAAEVLKNVIASSDFMNGVLSSIGEQPSKFGNTQEDQVKNWSDAVDVSTKVNTGIVDVSVYDGSRKENQKLTEAIINEIQSNGYKYHGNDNITLKKIGGPIYYDSPSFPVIWLNVLVAAALSFLGSIGILMFRDRKPASDESADPDRESIFLKD